MENLNSIFFISSALKTNVRSIYSNEERFNQTIKTIESIDKYCPNSIKYIFDSSASLPEQSYLEELTKKDVKIFYTGKNEMVNRFSTVGANSLGESLSFKLFLDWFLQQNIHGKRIYKISGRYQLNDNFSPGLEHTDSFVFKKSVDSWMNDEQKRAAGTSKLYDCRLWHMDYSLLKTFSDELITIINDCSQLGIDLEHSFYKNLHKYKVVELEKIGVCGNLAPNGEYVDD